MKKWEYKVIYSVHELDLNALGQDCWELVAIFVENDHSRANRAYFKRPIPTPLPNTGPR